MTAITDRQDALLSSLAVNLSFVNVYFSLANVSRLDGGMLMEMKTAGKESLLSDWVKTTQEKPL